MKPRRVPEFALAAALLVGAAGVALAHATLRRADPPAGAHVRRPPPALRLEFSEAVSARTSRIALVGPDSQRLSLVPRGDPAQATVLVADVPPLRVSGAYRVEWRLVGPDGHAVSGEYSFTVDSTAAAPSSKTIEQPPEQTALARTNDSLLQTGLRFLSSVALVAMIGSVAFALFVLPSTGSGDGEEALVLRRSFERDLRALASAAAWLLLVPAILRLLSNGVLLSGSLDTLQFGDVTDLLGGSTFGRGWLLQVASVIAALYVLRDRPSPRWPLAAAIVTLTAVSAAMLGHPASVADVPLTAIVVDAAHALAAGGWAGGILVVAMIAVPKLMKRGGDDRLVMVQRVLRAFSPLALTCAGILVLTGLTTAWLQLRSPGLLITSQYGQALLRKTVGVLAIAGLGAYHWRVAQPSLTTDRSLITLRRSLAIDVVLVLTVLVLTAILTGTAPPPR